jgi:phosphoglycerate kinase
LVKKQKSSYIFLKSNKNYFMLKLDQIQNSTVLVRVAFDLPSLDDTARVKDAIATIELLLKNKNKVVLATKWGRPKGNDLEFSTQKLVDVVESELATTPKTSSSPLERGTQVEFVNQFQSFEEAKTQILNSQKQIFLLENTHFSSDEKSKDAEARLKIAQKYASLADYFVDEAFPSSHREEATNTEIKEILPWTFGLAYANEIVNLDRLRLDVKKPFVVVMAGAKLETKLPLITKMLPKADKILIGGLLSFTFLQAAKDLGHSDLPDIYDSYVEVEFLEQAKELLKSNHEKLVLPLDLAYEEENGKKYGRDVGAKTLELFESELQKAQTIFWNGTLGFYEKPPFNQATLALGKYIADLKNSFRVLGGGDTGSSLPQEILEKLDFVSMGGGATLEYLSR